MASTPATLALRRRTIYTYLGITESQVAAQPQITPELRRIARTLQSTSPNAPRDPYYYLRSSDSLDAQKILAIINDKQNTLRGQRHIIPIEAICLVAKVSPLRVLEIVTATAVRLGATASNIIAAVAQSRVVEKTIEMALTDEGIEDRTMMHKATGFLPSPKGSSTIVNVAANASAQSHAQSASIAAPPPERTIKRMVDRFNDNPTLKVSAPLELPAARPADPILEQMRAPVREADLVDILDPDADEDDA